MPDSVRPRILVVEDESVIAMLIESMLGEFGFEVAGSAWRVEQAKQLAETGAFDAAVLDVNLHGELSYPVAEVLQSRGIPFVYTTGYGSAALPGADYGAPVLQKPFEDEDLAAALARLLAGRRAAIDGLR